MIMLLLNLCYMVRSDRKAHFSKADFAMLAEGILGVNESKFFEGPNLGPDLGKTYKNKESLSNTELGEDDDENLISLIYNRITSTRSSKKYSKLIKKFHNLFEIMSEESGSKLSYDYQLVNIFNNFIIDITSKNKKLYLVKFEVIDNLIVERFEKPENNIRSEKLQFDECFRYCERSDDSKQQNSGQQCGSEHRKLLLQSILQ